MPLNPFLLVAEVALQADTETLKMVRLTQMRVIFTNDNNNIHNRSCDCKRLETHLKRDL